MNKKIMIIGGGLAGLSAGIYAQKYGFSSTIIEKHNILGGECTGWYRNGNYIDGCIHWLMGTKKGTEMREVWEDLGAIDDDNIIAMDFFTKFVCDEGTVTVWRDVNKFKAELLEKAPEDAKEIKKFIKNIKITFKLEIPAKKRLSERNIFELIGFGLPMLRVAKSHHECGKYSLGEYALKYKSPLLRRFFESIFSSDHSLFSFIAALSAFMYGNADIPKGGSLDMSLRMENKYKELGGTVIRNTEVTEVITDGKIATGLVTKLNNSDKKDFITDFDYVLFACDADNVYHRILNNKYNDPVFESRFADEKKFPILSCCLVSFAVDADLSSYPHSVTLKVDDFMLAKKSQNNLSFRNYSYFKNKSGKTTVISMISQNGECYDFWNNLYNTDKKAYDDYKKEMYKKVISTYLKEFPELSDKIEYLDFTTPVTYNHYLNAYKGGYISFKKTKNTKWKSHHGEINGLDNCLMTGQWVQVPGGAPPAATSGRFAVLDIIKLEKKNAKKINLKIEKKALN